MADTLREQQFAMSRYLRDPVNDPPPPGIEERRLKVYRDVFFNSLQGLLASGFPIIRRVLEDSVWLGLVRAFYAEYRATTPYFTKAAGEFVAFLQVRSGDDPAWLAELAHYEWMETKLQLSDAPMPPGASAGDLLEQVLMLSPFSAVLGYRWPVTRIDTSCVPDTLPEQPTLLLLHRAADHRVHFNELSPPAYRLLESIAANRWTGREHIEALAEEAEVDARALMSRALAMLEQFRDDGIVLGTVQPARP